MGFANSVRAVLRLTLAAICEWPARPTDTVITVLGFATVAGILAAVLAMAARLSSHLRYRGPGYDGNRVEPGQRQ